MSANTFIQAIKARPAAFWALAYFLLLLLIRMVTGFNGLYGQDSHAYLAHSQALHEWMIGGPAPGQFFWPEGYPFLGALFSFVMDPVWAMQLLSMLSAAVGVYFFARLLMLLYPQGRQQAPMALLLLGLSPLLLRGGLLIMAESQCLALIIAGSYFLLRYRVSSGKAAIFLAGLCIGGAIVTRYPAALLLGLPAAWLGWMTIQRRDPQGLFLLLAGVSIALLPQFMFGNNLDSGLGNHHFLANWSVSNFFQKDFLMEDGQVHYRFSNIVYAIGVYGHPFLVGIAGVLGLVLLIRPGVSSWGRWAQLPVVIYLLFIGGIPFQNSRFLMLTVPYVMVLVYASFSAGEPFSEKWERFRVPIGIVIAVVHLALGLFLVQRFAVQSRLEKEIAEVVKSYPATTLYSFGMNQAIETYCPQIPTVSLWEEKLDTTTSGEHVLFNLQRYRKQWAGKKPMLNWEFLQKNYHLLEIHQFDDGWKLYEIR